MPNRELRLQTAINNLAKYFGINTIDNLIYDFTLAKEIYLNHNLIESLEGIQ